MGVAVDIFHNVRLQSLACYLCGVVFAMEEAHYKNRAEDKKEFFCPNGHGQFFTKGEVAKLREQLEVERTARAAETKRADAEKRKREWAESDAKMARERTEKVERKLKRTIKRVGNGVCPCCTRTFQNLGRHMTTQHPDYKDKV